MCVCVKSIYLRNLSNIYKCVCVYVISPSAKCSWNNIPSNQSELRDKFKEMSVLALQPELASTPLLFIALWFYG